MSTWSYAHASMEELVSSTILDICKLQHPKSAGLTSLESYMGSSTSISTEGIISNIKERIRKIGERINSVFDKVSLSLNKLIGKLGMLSELQKEQLEEVKQGKRDASSTDLPVSRQGLKTLCKALAVVAGAVFAMAASSRLAGKALKIQEDYTKSEKNRSRENIEDEKVRQNLKIRDTIASAKNQMDGYQKKLHEGKDQGASEAEIEQAKNFVVKLKSKIDRLQGELHTDAETMAKEKAFNVPQDVRRENAQRAYNRAALSAIAIRIFARGALFAVAISMRKAFRSMGTYISRGIKTLMSRLRKKKE